LIIIIRNGAKTISLPNVVLSILNILGIIRFVWNRQVYLQRIKTVGANLMFGIHRILIYTVFYGL
jgi:hypothetical protein